MSLASKVILITGAASGIGLSTAHLLASHGVLLSLADIQSQALKDLEADLTRQYPSLQILTQTVDVRDRTQVESWISSTLTRFARIDGCANLAGVIGKQSNVVGIEDIDDEEWDFVLGVNVTGLRNCLRAQVPHMKEGGAIVNAASILGLIGASKNLAYCASKHAVVGMTRAAAKELGSKGVRVNCICPGPIETPMLMKSYELRGSPVDYSWLPLGRSANQKEVPPLIEFLLSDAASFITGNAMPIDGGWYC